jgi:hypothetical protein
MRITRFVAQQVIDRTARGFTLSMLRMQGKTY